MKLNKIVAAAIFAFGAVATAHAATDTTIKDNQIHISGSIIDSPCSIEPGKSSLSKDLGQLSQNNLGTDGKSFDFTLQLTDCQFSKKESSEELNTIVKVTFRGTGTTTSGENFGVLTDKGETRSDLIVNLIGGGDATDKDKNIESGKPRTFTLAETVENQISFTATLKQHGTEKPKTGNFTSIIDFTLAYN